MHLVVSAELAEGVEEARRLAALHMGHVTATPIDGSRDCYAH